METFLSIMTKEATKNPPTLMLPILMSFTGIRETFAQNRARGLEIKTENRIPNHN